MWQRFTQFLAAQRLRFTFWLAAKCGTFTLCDERGLDALWREVLAQQKFVQKSGALNAAHGYHAKRKLQHGLDRIVTAFEDAQVARD